MRWPSAVAPLGRRKRNLVACQAIPRLQSPAGRGRSLWRRCRAGRQAMNISAGLAWHRPSRLTIAATPSARSCKQVCHRRRRRCHPSPIPSLRDRCSLHTPARTSRRCSPRALEIARVAEGCGVHQDAAQRPQGDEHPRAACERGVWGTAGGERVREKHVGGDQ